MGRRKKEKGGGRETQRAWTFKIPAEDLQWWERGLEEQQ